MRAIITSDCLILLYRIDVFFWPARKAVLATHHYEASVGVPNFIIKYLLTDNLFYQINASVLLRND